MRLEPNEHGNFLCPYCSFTLTPIFRVWLNQVTDYICHRCKKGFEIPIKSILNSYI